RIISIPISSAHSSTASFRVPSDRKLNSISPPVTRALYASFQPRNSKLPWLVSPPSFMHSKHKQDLNRMRRLLRVSTHSAQLPGQPSQQLSSSPSPSSAGASCSKPIPAPQGSLRSFSTSTSPLSPAEPPHRSSPRIVTPSNPGFRAVFPSASTSPTPPLSRPTQLSKARTSPIST